MYGNVRHVFLLADKPEHPLAIQTGDEWVVVRTTVTAVARGTEGVASDLIEFTHYVQRTA